MLCTNVTIRLHLQVSHKDKKKNTWTTDQEQWVEGQKVNLLLSVLQVGGGHNTLLLPELSSTQVF